MNVLQYTASSTLCNKFYQFAVQYDTCKWVQIKVKENYFKWTLVSIPSSLFVHIMWQIYHSVNCFIYTYEAPCIDFMHRLHAKAAVVYCTLSNLSTDRKNVVSPYGASPYCLFPGCIITWAWSLAKGQYMVEWLLTKQNWTRKTHHIKTTNVLVAHYSWWQGLESIVNI